MTVEQGIALTAAIVGPLVALISIISIARANRRANRLQAEKEERESRQAEETLDADEIERRFAAGRDLAELIRKEVEKQVEAAVLKIREELKTVRTEAHEMAEVVSTREVQLWIWNQNGRQGRLPMLPAPMLKKLGLAHFIPHDIEDTQPAPPSNTEGPS